MDRKQRVIADILRVNHAGECAAIRIYQSQAWISRWRAPDLSVRLRDLLGHEEQHRSTFAALMRGRRITPCHALTLWGLGGAVLGAGTALLGRGAILTCTAAVETTVHHHLDDQLAWIGDSDEESRDAIRAIQIEELGHLDWARSEGAEAASGLLYKLVALATGVLIWMSTYGASARMGAAVDGRHHTQL